MRVPERPRKAYHHGGLRDAMVDAAVELIAERGVHGFSIAEAARRVGVTSAAPYRHFADRDELLAAAAVRAAGILTTALQASSDDGSGGSGRPLAPASRLAAAARAYVRFAAEHRALFQTLVTSGLDKSAHPDLRRAAEPIVAAFVAPAAELAGGDGERLALAVAATAQGYATLLLDGVWGDGDAAVEAAAEQAGVAAQALAAGWPR